MVVDKIVEAPNPLKIKDFPLVGTQQNSHMGQFTEARELRSIGLLPMQISPFTQEVWRLLRPMGTWPFREGVSIMAH